MAIDFPASPTDQQIFSAANGVVYKYSTAYTSWLAQNPAPPLGGTGDFSAYNSAAFGLPASATTLALDTVRTGNAGLWYNTANGRWTPPAGRYFINAVLEGMSTSTAVAVVLQLAKNGTIIGTSIDSTYVANAYAVPTIGITVDANGADYFTLLGSATGTSAQGQAGACTFTAFPLTGMQGPPGPLPTAQSIMLYWSAASTTLSGTAGTFGWDVVGENTTGGSYTSGSGLFTIPANMGGLWDVSFCMQLSGSATTGVVTLRVNAADIVNAASPGTNSNGVSMTLNGRFRFAVGDVVSSRVMGTGTTTAFGTTAGVRNSWLHLTRVGP